MIYIYIYIYMCVCVCDYATILMNVHHSDTHRHTDTHTYIFIYIYTSMSVAFHITSHNAFPFHSWSHHSSPYWHLMISSSHLCGGLPSVRFRSLGYDLTTARVHLLSVNQWNFFFEYTVFTSFTLFRYQMILLRIRSSSYIPSMDLSITPWIVISHYSSYTHTHIHTYVCIYR